MNWRVWVPEDGDRPEFPNVRDQIVNDPRVIAADWVEDHWDDLDYPYKVLVHLEDDEGHRYAMLVKAENDVHFRAEAIGA